MSTNDNLLNSTKLASNSVIKRDYNWHATRGNLEKGGCPKDILDEYTNDCVRTYGSDSVRMTQDFRWADMQ